jgi:hypothetical protein
MTVYYNGLVEASMQGYNKGNVGPFITVHYYGLVEAFMQVIVWEVSGPSYWFIIMAK